MLDKTEIIIASIYPLQSIAPITYYGTLIIEQEYFPNIFFSKYLEIKNLCIHLQCSRLLIH